MPFEVEVTNRARENLKGLRKRDQQILYDAIAAHLVDEPDKPTRNRKHLEENSLAPWELRVGDFRVFYDVFEDQVLGWLVAPAKMMGSSQHSGFAMLAVTLAYFEPVGQFLEGKAGKSEAQFTLGMKAVFPAMAGADPILFSELYNQLRCGMFHRGITKGKVRVARGTMNQLVFLDPLRK